MRTHLVVATRYCTVCVSYVELMILGIRTLRNKEFRLSHYTHNFVATFLRQHSLLVVGRCRCPVRLVFLFTVAWWLDRYRGSKILSGQAQLSMNSHTGFRRPGKAQHSKGANNRPRESGMKLVLYKLDADSANANKTS